jgi:hypothetical protein
VGTLLMLELRQLLTEQANRAKEQEPGDLY